MRLVPTLRDAFDTINSKPGAGALGWWPASANQRRAVGGKRRSRSSRRKWGSAQLLFHGSAGGSHETV